MNNYCVVDRSLLLISPFFTSVGVVDDPVKRKENGIFLAGTMESSLSHIKSINWHLLNLLESVNNLDGIVYII